MASSFSNVIQDYAAYATPTQIWALCAGATKRVRLLYVKLEAKATAAGALRDVYLLFSGAVTGGTAASQAAITVPNNGGFPEAVPFLYSVIPSTPAPGNVVMAGRMAVVVAGSSTVNPILEFDFRQCPQYAPTIGPAANNPGAATADSNFSIRLDNAAIPAGFNMYLNAMWEEL
jgi:hypothetical protein